MNRASGIVLLIVGIALLVWGFNASESVSSEVSEVLSGAPSNKAIWLMISGAVCTGLGLFSVVRSGPH